MKVRYFEDTDTLLIELRDAPVTETRDLDENTVTIEHASVRADAPKFSFEKVAA